MLRKLCMLSTLLAAAGLRAETGADAWLRYAALDDSAARLYRQTLPAVVTVLSDAATTGSARDEWIRGIRGMLGRIPRVESRVPTESALVLGTVAEFHKAAP